MAEEVSIDEILRSLQNIVAQFKSELQQVKEGQLSPDDVSTIVEAHQAKQTDEVKQLQTAVTQLRVKSQQRISMDPEFMAEVKRMISSAHKEERSAIVENAVADHTGDLQDNVRAELQAYESQLDAPKPEPVARLAAPKIIKNSRIPVPTLQFVYKSTPFNKIQEERRQKILADREARKASLAVDPTEIEQSYRNALELEARKKEIAECKAKIASLQAQMSKQKNESLKQQLVDECDQLEGELLYLTDDGSKIHAKCIVAHEAKILAKCSRTSDSEPV